MHLFPSLIRRFFKRQEKPVLEKLEDIEDEILNLETARNCSLDSEKRFVFRLVVYSLIFFGLSFIIVYYYYWPTTQLGKAFMYTSLVVYPLIVSLLKWAFRSFFLRRISRTDNRLKILREAKQQLLEEVMEKETFRKAQQILKRFDPLMFASLSSLDNLVTETPKSSAKVPFLSGSEMHLATQKGFADGDNRSLLTVTPLRRTTISGEEPRTCSPPAELQPKTVEKPLKPRLLRPILPRERSVVDRLIDALVGDGPDRRFALICQQCSSHNGMALQEEFEFLAFRCCYCSHFNPPRRSRRMAPIPSNIAQSVPHLAFEHKPCDDGDSSEVRIRKRVSGSVTHVESPSKTLVETNGDDSANETIENAEEITINGDTELS